MKKLSQFVFGLGCHGKVTCHTKTVFTTKLTGGKSKQLWPPKIKSAKADNVKSLDLSLNLSVESSLNVAMFRMTPKLIETFTVPTHFIQTLETTDT